MPFKLWPPGGERTLDAALTLLWGARRGECGSHPISSGESSPGGARLPWPRLDTLTLPGGPGLFDLLHPAPPVQPNYCAAGVEPDGDTLVMLSATWCGYCRKARRQLQAEHVKHCEYDVEQSARGRELYDKSMANGVPVFLYRDRSVFGYDMERVRKMVARR